MRNSKATILVVDDQPNDAFVIQSAVEICLRLLGLDGRYEIRLASSAKTAEEFFRSSRAELVVTDLFMPEEDFQHDNEVRWNEMEFPHGLHLLKFLKETGVRALVTTFFWNYPGFERFRSFFEPQYCPNVCGALPKDIFYLVGMLRPQSVTASDDWRKFVPLRILCQALFSSLTPRRDDTTERLQLNPLQFDTLFDDATAWLNTHPYQVLELRKSLEWSKTVSGSKSRRKPRNHTALYSPASDALEISEYALSAPWRPSFVFKSAEAITRLQASLYRRLMQEVVNNDDWAIDLELPSAMALPYDEGKSTPPPQRRSFGWNDEIINVKYQLRQVERMTVDRFLTAHKPHGRRHAHLLLTLGFFSYWCHLPDFRASLTPVEMATLIQDRGQVSYGAKPREGLDKKKPGKFVENEIVDDIHYLNMLIPAAIRGHHNRQWWERARRSMGLAIEWGRGEGNEYRYWLNGSLVLRAFA